MKRESRTQWAARVARWRASGLRAADFAAREGVKANTLRWWASACNRLACRRPAFIEVSVPVPALGGRVEVVLPDGMMIRLSGEFDAAVLRRAVAALRSH
jgi:hypothetical protein